MPTAVTATAAAQQKRLRLYGAAAVILLLLIAAAWRWTPLHEFAEPKTIAAWLRGLRDSPWAPLVIVAVYVGANALLFPNTILNVATILGLGTTMGLPCALAGSLSAALVFYATGRRYGAGKLKKLHSHRIDALEKQLRNAGILGIATLRLLPVAPYTVVNVVAGAARVRLLPFAIGSLLGLLPGNLMVTAFGHQLRSVIHDPSHGDIAAMVGIVALAALGLWWLKQRAATQQKA